MPTEVGFDAGTLLDALGELNYLAVVVAAVAYFAWGGIWYSLIARNAWMRAAGVTEEQARGGGAMPMLFLGTFIAYLASAVVLATIARASGFTSVAQGIVLGLFVGVGIVAAQIWVNVAYEMRPRALFWINAANGIIGYTIMAVIVTIWV